MANAQYSDAASNWQPELVKIINGQPVRFRDVCVHEFVMGDVEDPAIYAAEPVWAWQQSELGQWVMAHAVEKPYWVNQVDHTTYGYRFRIMARLSEADQVFFKLKYVGTKN